jgi:hypothetical protein
MARHAPGCLLKNAHDGPCVSQRTDGYGFVLPRASILIGIDWAPGRDETGRFEPSLLKTAEAVT